MKMNWQRLDFDDERPCASQDCANTPEWHGEAGGTGAVYCRECRMKIENQPPVDIVQGGHYRHRKTGGIYIVNGIARVEATMDRVVVYRGVNPETWSIMDDDHYWTRPVAEFADGRFERIGYRRKFL